MNTLTFNYTQFIAYFPVYSDPTTYPQPLLQQYWDIAVNYVSDNANCGWLVGEARQYAIYLMMAHLLYLNGLIAQGQTPGLVQNATVDKVTVGLTPPPLKNQWQWWLSTSPYGQQLLALLQTYSVGGFYIGGSPILGSFRWGTVGRGGGCC